MGKAKVIAPTARLGERAVAMGYVTEEQVQQALDVQQDLKRKGRPHRLTGFILLEMGALSNDQLIDILKTYEADKRRQAD